MTMSKTPVVARPRLITPSVIVAVLVAAACMFALSATVASAAKVQLRVEGAKKTHFNGTVDAKKGTLPGGTDDAEGCRANDTAVPFTEANPLTALLAAFGAKKLETSGTFFSFGTMLCTINGERPKDAMAGWLVRINQQDSTRPAGYATATDKLKKGDRVLVYYSPGFGAFTDAYELTGPRTVRAGKKVRFRVAAYSTATDKRSWPAKVLVSGGGAKARTAKNGRVTLRFKRAGRFLVRATGKKAVRGSLQVRVLKAKKKSKK